MFAKLTLSVDQHEFYRVYQVVLPWRYFCKVDGSRNLLRAYLSETQLIVEILPLTLSRVDESGQEKVDLDAASLLEIPNTIAYDSLERIIYE